jgi:hypothetical protein
MLVQQETPVLPAQQAQQEQQEQQARKEPSEQLALKVRKDLQVRKVSKVLLDPLVLSGRQVHKV